jgi:hypothetical protein
MKQFLRYQISGLTFIFWVIVYKYGTQDWNMIDSIKPVISRISNYKNSIPAIIAIAIPFGIIIHQLSVITKNWGIAKVTAIGCTLFKPYYSTKLKNRGMFDDFPSEKIISKIEGENNKVQYCLEKISNLNSFYYVRFDNGILAPLIAIVFVSINDHVIKLNYIVYFLTLAVITGIYIIRIKKEMIIYKRIILDLEKTQNHKNSQKKETEQYINSTKNVIILSRKTIHRKINSQYYPQHK